MKLSTRQFFELVDLQARMALKSEASRLLLSYAWWIIEPILFVLLYYFVFAVLICNSQENFLLFLLCGKVPFMWFSKSVTLASNSISQNKYLITQLDIPKIIFPMVSIQQSLYKESFVFALMIGIAFAFGHWPNQFWLLLIPLFLVQYLLIFVVSVLGAIAVARMTDCRMVINMTMTFLLFVSGVFWDVNSIHDMRLKNALVFANPIAFLLDSYRRIIIHGEMINLPYLALLTIFLLLAAYILTVFVFRRGRLIASWALNS